MNKLFILFLLICVVGCNTNSKLNYYEKKHVKIMSCVFNLVDRGVPASRAGATCNKVYENNNMCSKK